MRPSAQQAAASQVRFEEPVQTKAFRPARPPVSKTRTQRLGAFKPAASPQLEPSAARNARTASDPLIRVPGCSRVGAAGAGCTFEVTGARIVVEGAVIAPTAGTTKPLVIDVHVVNENGTLGRLLGSCSGDLVCIATIATDRLPHGIGLQCTIRSSAGPTAFGCSPFSSDTPLDYTIHLRRSNGTEQWLPAKVGAPQPIDASGTGTPDASVLLLAGPAAVPVPPSTSDVPPDSETTNARLLVASAAGNVIPFALEIYYQTSQLYHFGFDGRSAGAPAQFEANIAASADVVTLRALPTNPSTELTLLGGVLDGTIATRSWPASSIDAAVVIGPVPPSIDVTIEPAGRATVGVTGAPNVRATIDQFESSSDFAGRRARTVANMPQGAPATLDVKWNSTPVDGRKASTFTLNPTPALVELNLQHSQRQVVRDANRGEKETLLVDAIATIKGIPAGDTTIQMIGGGDDSKIVLAAPSAIGSIEFGFGDRTAAAFWAPPTAGDDYVFMKLNPNGTMNFAVRVGLLVGATVSSRPVAGRSSSLTLSMTHTPATMHLYIERGQLLFYGSLVPPAVTEAEIITDGSKVTVKPESSGDIEDIALHARTTGAAFFGTVKQIDLTLSNVGPDTTITVDSNNGNLRFTFDATVPIRALDAQLRAGDTPSAILPPDTDGILLHQDAARPDLVPFTAHVHLSGLTKATVTKLPSPAAGAKPDDLELMLDLQHDPRTFVVNVLDGVKRIWGSFLLPQALVLTVDTGSTSASVGSASSDDIRDIDLHLRTTGDPFFGRVKQMDMAVSNIPVGASFGVSSTNSSLNLAYSGGTRAIGLADVHLRQEDAGSTIPAGTDGVLLHDLAAFSAHFRLGDLLAMRADKQDCGSASQKCQRINATVERATQRNTVVNIQSVPDDTICFKSGTPPVETCRPLTTTPDSVVFSLDNAPRVMQIGMKTVSDKVFLDFGTIKIFTNAFRGIEINYGAGDASGAAVLNQTGASSKVELEIASLPAGPYDEGNRRNNAVYFCVYKSSHCTTPPRDVSSTLTNPSLQFFGSSAVTVTRLFTCSSQADCAAGKGIHGSQLTTSTLQFAYAEREGTVYNDRYIFADTGGRASTADGHFWMDSPDISIRPSGLWADNAQVQLGAAYAPVKSYGKIRCEGLNLTVFGVGIPATALHGLTDLCG